MSVTDPAVVPAPALPDEPASVPRPGSPEVPQRQHPSISDELRDTLLKARQAILDNPDQFEMNYYDRGDQGACIAGWCDRVTGRGRAEFKWDHVRTANVIFKTCWPNQFYNGYNELSKPAQAEVAAARIIHFIETGE